MSRVAKYPVKVPAGVEIKLDGDQLTAKGGQGAGKGNFKYVGSLNRRKKSLYDSSNVPGWRSTSTSM